MGKGLHTQCLLWTCVVLLVQKGLAQSCNGVLDSSSGSQICYTYHSSPSSFTDALSMCQSNTGSTLARIQNEAQHNTVRQLIAENSGGADINVWIGGRIRTQSPLDIWRCIQDKREISGQGCYFQYENNDPSGNGDTDIGTDITRFVLRPLIPENCVLGCQNSNYDYAGLQNGDECWCSDDFGKWGGQNRSYACTLPCPGEDNSVRCGGVNQNEVFRVDGAYSNWAYGQPNNYTGYQACAAMLSRNDYKFEDEDCHLTDDISFVCKIDGACSGDESEGRYVSRGSTCYYFRSRNANVDWFSAREICISKGGDLMCVDDQEEFDFIQQQMIDNPLYPKYWIGLTNRIWEWTTGEEMIYFKWPPLEPSTRDHLCVTYRYDGNTNLWETSNCDVTNAFICQYEIGGVIPTTSITTTTTTIPTTIPTTTVPTTTTSTTSTAPATTATTVPPSTITMDTIEFNGVTCTGILDMSTSPPVCYTYHYTRRSFEDALNTCKQVSGRTLATPRTDLQRMIVQRLVQLHVGEDVDALTWIGGRKRNGASVALWQWLKDLTMASGQGCYFQYENNDSNNWADFNELFAVDQPPLTPEKCIQKCRAQGYTYAGLQNGDECWCDDSFGAWGGANRTNQCTSPCPAASGNSLRCGGPNLNEVFAVDGAYSNWGYARPNNYSGYQACAVMNKDISYKFDDEDCHLASDVSFICQIDNGACPQRDSYGEYHESNGDCYYIRLSDADKTWFEAREICIQKGGDLVSIESQEEFDYLNGKIPSPDSPFSNYWIGLTSALWEWVNEDEITRHNWVTSEPDTRQHNCIAHQYKNEGSGWADYLCEDSLPYVCQYADPTQQTPTASPDGGTASPDYCAGVIDSTALPPVCYTYHSDQLNFNDSLSACRQHGADSLARVDNVFQHDLMSSLVINNADSSDVNVWIGGRVRSQTPQDIWTWVKDDSIASGQGCYMQYEDNDPANWRDFSTRRQLPNTPLTPQLCVAGCRNDSYHFAALQNGDQCYCGNTFGRWGGLNRTNLCTLSCPQISDNSLRCGGVNFNDVYAVDGSYSNWGYAKPNNYSGYQACAVMDRRIDFKFDDEDCYNTAQHSFICELDDCQMSHAYGDSMEFNSKCFYIRTTNAFKTWFDARDICGQAGGDLVTIENHAEFNFLYEQLSNRGFTKYWIGLTSRVWEWTTGEEMTYYRWPSSEPSNQAHLHVTLRYNGTATFWETRSGVDTYGYICQSDVIINPTTTTPTTTTTTTPTTTTTTPTTTTTATTTTMPTTTRPTTTTLPSTLPPTTTIPTTTTPSTTTTTTATPTTTMPTTTMPTTTSTTTTITTTAPTTTSTTTTPTTTMPTTTTTAPTTSMPTTTTIAPTTTTIPTTTTVPSTTTPGTTTTSTTSTTPTTSTSTTTATTTTTSTTTTRPPTTSTAMNAPATDPPVATEALETAAPPDPGALQAGASSNNNNNDDDLSSLEIVLIVVVIIILLLAAILIITVCYLKNRNNGKNQIGDSFGTINKHDLPPVYTGYDLDSWYKNTCNSQTGLVDPIPKKNRRARQNGYHPHYVSPSNSSIDQ